MPVFQRPISCKSYLQRKNWIQVLLSIPRCFPCIRGRRRSKLWFGFPDSFFAYQKSMIFTEFSSRCPAYLCCWDFCSESFFFSCLKSNQRFYVATWCKVIYLIVCEYMGDYRTRGWEFYHRKFTIEFNIISNEINFSNLSAALWSINFHTTPAICSFTAYM